MSHARKDLSETFELSLPNDDDLSQVDPDDDLSASDSPLLVPTDTLPRARWMPKFARGTAHGDAFSTTASRSRTLLAKSWHAIAAWAAGTLRIVKPTIFTWRRLLVLAVTAYCLVTWARGRPLLASPLPGYTGPYRIGAMDLEIPLDKPRLVSNSTFKDTGAPAFQLDTVLFTLYYPVDNSNNNNDKDIAQSDLPRHLWFPRPISIIARGFARFAHVDNFLVRPIFTLALWAIGGSITIPADVDAPLMNNTHVEGFGASSSPSSSRKLPLLVFSHGMASSRTDYTNYLGEMASRGHVVAAVEHRDGSSPGTIVKMHGKPDRVVLHFDKNDVLSDPPMDAPRIKVEQLAFRDAEMVETVRVLQRINSGYGQDVYASNPRGEGRYLQDWEGRLDFDLLTIGGHSYGATGALQTLKSAPSLAMPAIGGIILDPGKESGPLNADIDVPILVVHSNSWSKTRSIFFGRPHFDTVRDLVTSVLDRTGAAWFVTSLGTSHPSVTDAPLLEPLLLSWTTGATLNVKEALKEYVKVSVDFLDFLRDGKRRGLLDQAVTHPHYNEWINDKRKQEFPKDLAKLWEVHVSPVDEK